MSEIVEPHPLDDVEESPQRSLFLASSNAYLPLLKPSIIIAIACVFFIFMSGVATQVAAPNSLLETVGSFLFRACSWVLLLACAGMLISFRIPQIKQFLATKERVRWKAPRGFWILTCANLLGILISYGVLWLVSSTSIGGPVLVFLAVLWIAVSITMAFLSESYMKGFFIGNSVVLAIYFIVLNFNNSPILSLLVSQPMYSSYGTYLNYTPQGAMGLAPWIRFLFLALPWIAGLVCAYCVLVSEWANESKIETQKKHKSLAFAKKGS